MLLMNAPREREREVKPLTLHHISTLGLTSYGESICEFIKNAKKTNGDDAAECYEYPVSSINKIVW
jgi:hypothetical protein